MNAEKEGQLLINIRLMFGLFCKIFLFFPNFQEHDSNVFFNCQYSEAATRGVL